MKHLVLLIFSILTLSCFCQNQPPVSMPDTVQVVEQVPFFINVKANDYDPDGDEFHIYDCGPSYSTAAQIEIVNDMIRLKTYPEKEDVYAWYTLYDGQAFSTHCYITVTVLPNPELPVAVDDEVQLPELVPSQINILGNDFDPDGDNFKIHSVPIMVNCQVNINDDSLSVTVTPQLSSTEFYFSYNLIEKNTSESFISHRAYVSGTTMPNPDIPVITPDLATATGGISITIDVLSNDYDNQNDQIEVSEFTQPQHGTLSLDNNLFYYTPALSYKGEDFFEYSIRETANTGIYTKFARVTIDVSKNPGCPVGVPDYASTMTGKEVFIDVLPNDYDPNNDAFEIMDIQGGTVADNKIRYKSSYIQFHADTIYYRIVESNNPESFSEWTPVYITLDVNPALPVAVADTIWVSSGIPVSLKPLANDIPNGADTLILRYYSSNQQGHWGAATIVNDTFYYRPAYQANGTDRFRYSIWSSTEPVLAVGEIVIFCESKYYDSLQISNINAGVNGSGPLFYRFCEIPGGDFIGVDPPWAEELTAHFRYPKGAITSTIFSSSMWAGGLSSQDVLHLSSDNRMGPGGSLAALQPGPVAKLYDTAFQKRYARTWKVSREQVEFHRNNYWNPTYTPPEAILNWPANGLAENGEATILAPFYDRDADGVYDCRNGDYPLIRGDETIFIMYNDDIDNGNMEVEPVKLEVHAMVYGFANPSDTAEYNSVFVHYDFINRSNETYHDFYIGASTDIDIGSATDDNIGSDVTNGAFYAYNGKPTDGEGQYWAYGEDPPAQGVVILAGPFKDTDNIDNQNIACSESINGLNYGNGIKDDERLGMSYFMSKGGYVGPGPYKLGPLYTEDYYLLQGKWYDGSRLSYGGNGHVTVGAVGPDARYMYPGDSDPFNWGTNCQPPNGNYNTNGKFWTYPEAGNNPGDKRGLASMGPITFRPGQMQELELAFCVGQSTPGVPGSALENLLKNIKSLREKVTGGEIIEPNDLLGYQPSAGPSEDFRIYPNPATELLTIEGPYLKDNAYSRYTIFNILGTKVTEGRLTNQPDKSAQTINISNLKPGVYLLRIHTPQHSRVVKFIRK